jgi:transposase
MAKLTNEQKIEIYNKRKMGYTLNMLSTEYNINVHGIEYLVRLIDKNGFDVLRKDRNRYYSPKFKEKALRRVFIDGESITAVAIDIGLSSRGILANWIKSYVENGYNIVEKKRGQHDKQKEKMTQSEMQKKIKELELQNLRLRVENEYLKKLDALVMERKKKELKK